MGVGPPSAPEPFPGEQWEWEPLDDTLPNEPESSDEPLIQVEQEAAEETPPSDPEQGKLEEAFAPSRGRGRPSKDMEVERAIDALEKRHCALSEFCSGNSAGGAHLKMFIPNLKITIQFFKEFSTQDFLTERMRRSEQELRRTASNEPHAKRPPYQSGISRPP